MKKKGKKLIALVMAVAVCAGFMPLQSVMAESEPVSSIEGEVSAGETEAEAAVLSEEASATTLSESAIVDSGTCGDNLTWVLTEDGTLTISGEGEMDNYSLAFYVPWYDERESITAVVMKNGITNIGDYAFYYCTSLTSITMPDSVTSIGYAAFARCSSLEKITIPDGVTSIGISVFYNCSSLTEITMPDSVISIGTSAFEGCSSLAKITIPEGVTAINGSVFSGCSSLTEITIPEGVASIGGYAFSECSSLAKITIPDSVTSIEWYAFSGCSSLTEITIPDGVTSIEIRAFSGCSSLTEITIPDGVTSIGMHAFLNCSNLTEITIPNSVTSVGYAAFQGCSSLTDIYYGGSEEEWDAIAISDGNSYLTNATIHYNSTGPAPNGSIRLETAEGTAGKEVILSASLVTTDLVPVDSDVTWSITSASGDETEFQATWGDTSILTVAEGEYIISCPVTVDTDGWYDVTITISNGLSASAWLIVSKGPGIYASGTLVKGGAVILTLVSAEDNIDTSEVVWESSDTSIIDVSGSGAYKFARLEKAGTVTITVTYPDGETESLTIEVEPVLEKKVETTSQKNAVSEDGTVESEVTLCYVELEDDEMFDLESFLSEIVVELAEDNAVDATILDVYYEISEDGTYAEIKVSVTYTLGDEGTIDLIASTNGEQETEASVTVENVSDIFDLDLSYAKDDGGDDDVARYQVTAAISEATGTTSWEGDIRIVLLYIGDNAEVISSYGAAEQSADSIDAGGTLTFTWVVDIEKSAYPDGGAHEIGFAVYFGDIVLEDQMLSIAVDASNGESNALDFDTDVWDFGNFSESDYTPTSTYHIDEISDTDKNALLTGMSPSDYAKIINVLETDGNGGHCFSMSLTTILSKMNIFDISDYSTASCLRDADFTNEVNSILCYYQCLQNLDSFISAIQTYMLSAYDSNEDGTSYEPKTDEEEYRQGVAKQLTDLAEAAAEVENGGAPVLFCFSSDVWGQHAVVAYGTEHTDSDEWTWNGITYSDRILIYDSNSTEDDSNSTKDDEERYLYFNEGTDEWIIPHYYKKYGATNENSYLMLALNDLSILNTENYDASLYNYIAELSVQNETAMRLANSSNEYTIPGDTDLATYYDAEALESGESSTSTLHVILPDENDDYTLTTLSGEAEELDFYLSDEDLYMSIEAEAATGATFSIKRVFSLLGNEGSYEIKIADDDLADEAFNTYTISGENTGDITVEVTKDGLLISGDDLTEVTVTGGDREAEAEVIFNTENDSVLIITSDDNTELAVLIDTDEDGTYETTISSSDSDTTDDDTTGSDSDTTDDDTIGNTGADSTDDDTTGSGNDTGSTDSDSTDSESNITVQETSNGTATVTPSDAGAGDAVTITVTPDEGYELSDLIVTDENGNEITVTDNGDGTYSFVMPDGEVTVTTSFEEEAQAETGSPSDPDNSGSSVGSGSADNSSTDNSSTDDGSADDGSAGSDSSAGGSSDSGSSTSTASPGTGDSADIGLWMTVLLAGGTGIAALILVRRRRAAK